MIPMPVEDLSILFTEHDAYAPRYSKPQYNKVSVQRMLSDNPNTVRRVRMDLCKTNPPQKCFLVLQMDLFSTGVSTPTLYVYRIQMYRDIMKRMLFGTPDWFIMLRCVCIIIR